MKYKFIDAKHGVNLAGRILTLTLSLFVLRAHADNPFAEIVRKTGPQSPELEQKAFHLPPGFQIELVAADPDIDKPINMAFDEKGRLWITQSREYPFPAPSDKPAHDKIQILSDFDAHGRAKKITTFADGLNIPIGLYPYKDGAIAYSIPYIYQFHDTNHDGHADQKELLLGKFGYEKDTHGMTSSFRRGYDGWLYANHGFNNESVITARDGSSIRMHSGNTYRMRIDGSHVEQFAWGRVNPFGLMFDPLGNIYASDCETLPIYQLLRGGYYPSFGKPNDGLGFAPPMMDHKHGSTAIAGVVYYAATNFPPAFRDNIFVGNVMTCRIDRDSINFHGSSPWAKEEQDFLSCDDPWFRPVDIELGPDGAMYVADFYNRIIGHYEVPLDHPGRDRERGRIWRITYHGEQGLQKSQPMKKSFDLTKASTSELIKYIGSENITIRMLAMNQLVDRVGAPAIRPVAKMLSKKSATPFQKIHGMWVLYRLGGLDPKILATLTHDADHGVRVHAMRLLAEMPTITADQHALIMTAMQDSDALVQRCAAEALGQHPELVNVRALLDAREHTATNDTHMLYVVRMALRNQLLVTNIFDHLPFAQWTEADEDTIAGVCPGTPSPAAARFLLRHIEKYKESHETIVIFLKHIARYLPENEIGGMVTYIREHFGNDMDFQLALFKSIQEATAQRGGTMNEAARAWGEEIALALADTIKDEGQDWTNFRVEGTPDSGNPWGLLERPSQDGNNRIKFFSSLAGGEHLTGVLRSKPFPAPEQLSYFMAGHDGPMDKPRQNKNGVRVRLADTHEIIAKNFAPRDDTAHAYTFDLKAHAGEQVYIEIFDTDTGGAYAWVAAGRFSPEIFPMPKTEPRASEQRKKSLAEMAKTFKMTKLESKLTSWLTDKMLDTDVRVAAGQALLAINPDAHAAVVGEVCADVNEPATLRQKMGEALAELNTPAARDTLVNVLISSPERMQVKFALSLAGSMEGAEKLLELTESGKAPRRLLLQRQLTERLNAIKPKDVANRIATQTKGLAPLNDEIQKVIDQRKVKYNPAKAVAASGAKVFTQNCFVCHSIDNQGGAVGPHLDGVGNRGLDRLLEDVLDPSRNVDPSFRYSTVTLKDGTVFTGLQRREEGEAVVFVDSTGKEMSVAKKEIESRVESKSSLMPDNFSEVIPLEDFNNLMAFLLSKGSQTTAKK